MRQVLPNALGAYVGGLNAAHQQREIKDERHKSAEMKRLMPQVMAGDQSALNALAAVDPNGAYRINRDNQSDQRADAQLEMSRERLEMARSQAKAQAMKVASTLSAAERKVEAEKISKGLAGAYQFFKAGDEQGYNNFLAQSGLDPAEYPMGQFQAHAASMEGVVDALKSFDDVFDPEEKRTSLQQRALDAGLQPGTPQYEEFMLKGGADKDGLTVFGPDGNPLVTTGDPSKVRKLSENQSKLTLFGSMMKSTMPVINGLEETFDPSNVRDNLANSAGIAGNYAKSPEFRRYDTAAKAWAEGVLRIQTGAAATQPEIQRVRETYFAMIGDDAETVAFKRQLRSEYADAIGAASGGLINPNEGLRGPSQQPIEQPPQATSALQYSPEDFLKLPEDEQDRLLELWEAQE